MAMKILNLLMLIAAAALEVGGDALVRSGLRGSGKSWSVALGFAVVGAYGVVVNLPKWDFGRLLGTYVGVFAAVTVLFSRFVFQERVSRSTILGVLIVLAGSAVIQMGQDDASTVLEGDAPRDG